MRVISLIASSTEIVCALGMQSSLVGRSHECDYPPEIRSLPPCTETKFGPDGKSYEIDQRIKAILQEGLSVYRVDGELLSRLRPDVILTQIQCEVCAVSRKDVEKAACDWVAAHGSPAPRIVSLETNCLADLWRDIRLVAEALGVPARGDELVTRLQARVRELTAAARAQPARPRVACIEWIEPLMAAGNWVPELVELAGGRNLFGVAGKHSPWMSMEALVASDPDVIVVMPCGWGIDKARSEMGSLERDSRWGALRAVRERRVFCVDGNQYFNRPGPRLVDSLGILAEIFHESDAREQGEGWVKYS
jgi:iron complex transport system substrate-binding protein